MPDWEPLMKFSWEMKTHLTLETVEGDEVLAHIVVRWVETAWRGKVETTHNETNSSRSIRITNISVDKRLTNDLYRFLVFRDQLEVQGREAMAVDDGDEQPWWLLIAYLENSHSAGLNINKLYTNLGITSFILNRKLWFYIHSKALTWGYILVFLGPERPVWTGLNRFLSVFIISQSWKTEDRTTVTVLIGPDNFRSWSVRVRSGLGLFPVL